MNPCKRLILPFAASCALFAISACAGQDSEQKSSEPAPAPVPPVSDSMPNKQVEAEQIAARFPESLPIGDSGLRYIIIREGDGAVAEKGSNVSVNYRGMVWNGDVFDSSYDRGKPIQFTLGTGRVIKGWDQGIPGMRVGEKRKLIIPYAMAYGDRGRPPAIPPRATLIFDVELMGVN